jgi:hypothetical protein
MATIKHVRETKELLRGCGVIVTDVVLTKNHIKFYVQFGSHTRLFIRAASPSDGRSGLNFKSDVRKWLERVKNEKAN